MTAWFLGTGLCLLGAALIPADVSIRRNRDNSSQRTHGIVVEDRLQSTQVRCPPNRWNGPRHPAVRGGETVTGGANLPRPHLVCAGQQSRRVIRPAALASALGGG